MVSVTVNLAAERDGELRLNYQVRGPGWQPSYRATLDTTKASVQIERPRTALNRNDSPDIPFDRSFNAYRGCEHGCIYCFARPTHAYHDLSPGLDFETKLFAKPDAADGVKPPCVRCANFRPRTIIARGRRDRRTNQHQSRPASTAGRVSRRPN